MSEDGFLEAVLAMRTKLYHVAMAILWNEQDAADAVQEAMLKGWKRRGSLRDEAAFSVWFARILVNQCRDMQRRQIKRRRALEALAREPREASRETGLLEAIHELPDGLRLPVLLCYFDGYSQRETGEILGLTEQQVKGRVRQARDRLRVELSEGGGANG